MIEIIKLMATTREYAYRDHLFIANNPKFEMIPATDVKIDKYRRNLLSIKGAKTKSITIQ